MRQLSQCEIFKASDVTNEITKTITGIDINKYIVDTTLYDHYLKIFKGYKYELSKAIVNEASKNSLKLCIFADPKDSKDQKILNIPTQLFSFIAGGSGKLISIADISSRAGYARNKLNSTQIDTLKITERDLYAYLQTAFLNLILRREENKINFYPKFIKLSAEAYSNMLAKCIDKTYPIGAEKDNYVILTFLCAVFFIQYVLGLDSDRSVQYALSIKTVNKNVVEKMCHALKESIKMDSVEDFIKIVENEFEFIKKGSLLYRNLIYQYMKMYGQNALYSMENAYSFINMLQMSDLRIGMFNDNVIDSVAGLFVKQIDTVLLEVYGE